MKYFLDADEVLWYNIKEEGFWLTSVNLEEIEGLINSKTLVLDSDLINFLETKAPEDLYIISNNKPEYLQRVLKRFDISDYFKEDNISCEISPKGRRIKYFLQRDNIDPNHAVLIDDREANLCDALQNEEDLNLILLNRYKKIRKIQICGEKDIPVINSMRNLI